MTREEARKIFQPYIDEVTDENLRCVIELAWERLPDYFFVKPASSTGKYHPKFANGDGGLVRHTAYAIEVWKYLYRGFEEELCWTMIYQCGIIALMFHDALKYGDPNQNLKYTTNTHSEDAAEWMLNIVDEVATSQIESEPVRTRFYGMCKQYIVEPIEHHMGPWSFHGAPEGLAQKLVFIADYVASQPTFEKELFKCENN